jgi:hypothetical protein
MLPKFITAKGAKSALAERKVGKEKLNGSGSDAIQVRLAASGSWLEAIRKKHGLAEGKYASFKIFPFHDKLNVHFSQ